MILETKKMTGNGLTVNVTDKTLKIEQGEFSWSELGIVVIDKKNDWAVGFFD